MPPKKRAKPKDEPEATKSSDTKQAVEEQPAVAEADNGNAKNDEHTEGLKHQQQPANDHRPTKRRKKDGDDGDQAQKPSRRSGRGVPKSRPSQEQLIKYMLSMDARELCRPEDEIEDIKTRGSIRTYTSGVLNPFEELLCAVVLSRPISHRLGLRTIRTILNNPYKFNSAKAIQAAGNERHHQAVWDARTQHKAKTAEQIGMIADVVLDKCTRDDDAEGTEMEKVRENCNKEVEKERDYLKTNIKGLGATGLDIFFRRVQWLWTEGYPFVDDRTMQSLKKLGLPEEAEDLEKLIQENWSKLNTKDITGDDDAMRKRRALVTLLERATGSDLENKQDLLMEAAANA